MSSLTPVTEAEEKLRIVGTAKTDIGLRREENQDSYGTVENDHFQFFFVADGMGGVKGGAIASQLAVSILSELFKHRTSIDTDALIQATLRVNTAIFERGAMEPGLAGMGTTLVGICVYQDRLFILNVGDSRAYRMRNGEIAQLTDDHTLVNELLRSGAISEDQVENHPVSHMLTRSLGPTPTIEVDCWIEKTGFQAGDRYLLCSDGLYNLVSSAEMLEIVTELPVHEATNRLVNLANERGGTDNITVIVVEVDRLSDLGAELNGTPVVRASDVSSEQELVGEEDGEGESEEVSSESLTIEEPEVVQEEDDAQIPSDEDASFEKIEPEEQLDLVSEEELLDDEKEESEEAAEAENSSTDEDSEDESMVARKQEATVVSPTAKTEKIDRSAVQKEEESLEAKSPEAAQTGPGLVRNSIQFLATVLIGVLGTVVYQEYSLHQRESYTALHHQTLQPETGSEGNQTARAEVEEGYAPPEEPESVATEEESEVSSPELAEETQIDTPSPLVASDEIEILEEEEEPAPVRTLDEQEVLRIQNRIQELKEILPELQGKLASFEAPLSGDIGEKLKDGNSLLDALKRKRQGAATELKSANEGLKVLFNRQSYLEDGRELELATELSSSIEEVNEAKAEFEKVTWLYLRALDNARSAGENSAEKEKARELFVQRKDAMAALKSLVQEEVNAAIREQEEKIRDKTEELAKIEYSLQKQEQEVNYLRALLGSDPALRTELEEALSAELEAARQELSELQMFDS